MKTTETKFMVVIVGGGKLAYRIARGISRFIPTFRGKKVFTVILRVRKDVRSDDNTDKFITLKNVTVESNPSTLRFADLIILAVPPKEEATNAMFAKIAPVIAELKTTVLSFVSGLSMQTMRVAFKRKVKQNPLDVGLIHGTLNTNEDTGNGVVYLAAHPHKETVTTVREFLKLIADVRTIKGRFMARIIAGVGSMNAYEGEFILRLYSEDQVTNRQLPVFIAKLVDLAEAWNPEVENQVPLVHKWLSAKVAGYQKIGMKHQQAVLLSRISFLSTANSFLDDLQNKIALLKRIESVPTKGGCTEFQLQRQRTLSNAKEMCDVIPDIIFQTHLKAQTMKVKFSDNVLTEEGRELWKKIVLAKKPMF